MSHCITANSCLPSQPAAKSLLPSLQLFPSIDANHDGIITSEEMQRHLFLNGIAVSRRRAEAEFSDTDANADGKVTATEYLNTLLEEADEETRRKKAGVDLGTFPDPLDYSSYIDVTRAGFMYADRNHDGALDPEEFFDFLNPEGEAPEQDWLGWSPGQVGAAGCQLCGRWC